MPDKIKRAQLVTKEQGKRSRDVRSYLDVVQKLKAENVSIKTALNSCQENTNYAIYGYLTEILLNLDFDFFDISTAQYIAKKLIRKGKNEYYAELGKRIWEK